MSTKGPLKGIQPKRCKVVQLASKEIIASVKKPVPSGQLEPITQSFTPTIKPREKKEKKEPKEQKEPKEPKEQQYVKEMHRDGRKIEQTLQDKLDINESNAIFKDYIDSQNKIETDQPYKSNTVLYTPQTRKSFYKFISDTYKTFKIPPQIKGEIDKNACSKLGSGDAIKAFSYQEFIREYIRNASPYRGVLVYHGLGSGKTCSAIAAAEALYGTSNKKIIVMTPFSLRGNFISEISFCGFKHFNVQNHWVKESLISEEGITYMYAQSVLSLSTKFLADVLKRPEERVYIWIPDFTKEPNFDDLDATDQNDIRSQITNMIENRITFISYNGVTSAKLKEYACNTSENGERFFDNSIIVIDEIHNLTRLMQGSITPYIIKKPEGRGISEPIVPGKWIPSQCATTNSYKRSYLFYKLLTDARNSKIIGLSGTPIINFPDELGILANVLSGYIECVEFNLVMKKDAEKYETFIKRFTDIVESELRVDIIRCDPKLNVIKVLISVFNEGYERVNNTEFIGVRYNEDAQDNIKKVFERIKIKLKDANFLFDSEKYISYPRLPSDDKEFKMNFINPANLSIKNDLVLKKRLSGLISYYKGSKEEYMPKIEIDETIECVMSNHVLENYIEQRKTEIISEKNKDNGDAYAAVEEFARMKNPSSYRFRSRALCNFTFPKGIKRPFPNTPLEEFKDAPIIDSDDIDLEVEEVEPEEEPEEEMKGGADEVPVPEVPVPEVPEVPVPEVPEVEVPVVPVVVNPKRVRPMVEPPKRTRPVIEPEPEPEEPEQKISYQDSIKIAMNKLLTDKDKYLKLGNIDENDICTDADNNIMEGCLSKFSTKMDKMIRKIMISKGSNLVYSQFKTVEGLGVLGIALKANGFFEIEIEGNAQSDTLKFSDETIDSFTNRPEEKRFMFLTGDGVREKRNLILNIFNGYFDKIPESMRNVLEPYENKNKKGEICWIIGITGAGAEGISLKCCRSVHIMEPYWNKVRLDQVKGRAIRICSHQDLEYEDRTVDIYTYYTVFSKKQMKELDQSIRLRDVKKSVQNQNDFYIETSDENVYNVAVKKDIINKALLDLMKESAIDCSLNAADNDVDCFKVEGNIKKYLFDPDLQVDIMQTSIELKEVKEEKEEKEEKRSKHEAQIVEMYRTKGKLERFIIYPKKGNIIYNIYDILDDTLTTPIGEIQINPLYGTFKGSMPVFK